ncbi:HNH endonuclease [Pseudoalteromonas gelatinilytica]
MTQLIKLPQPGDVLNNAELCAIFLCSPQGGMRRSHKTNTLVIVSNHVKSIYDDRWDNGVLHYTGMGTNGDQSLDFAQNKTLAESNESQIQVHLFEVFVELEYIYIGTVSLAAEPYFEKQLDQNNLPRMVCVFPLKLKSGEPSPIDKNHLNKVFETKTRKAKRLAKGFCMLCDQPAPFKNKSGEPYLEVHHIVWLSKGGEDTIANTVALCPNCHRKMHIQNDQKDIKKLQRPCEVNTKV